MSEPNSEHHSQDFASQIANLYAELSPSARTIANFLQQHPFSLITMSVAQIAQQTNTSKATVSRFFRQLGYDSHQQLKAYILKQREQGLPVAQSSNEDPFALEMTNLTSSFKQVSTAQIAAVASMLLNARKVVLFGARTSYPIALSMCQQLKQIRDNVSVLPSPGQTLSEEIVDLTAEDYIVVFGFRRRPNIFKELIDSLSHCNTLLVTDPSGQIYRSKVNELLVCQLGQTQAFDSYTAPMALVSMICNQAYQQADNTGQGRSHAISRLYAQLNELS